MKDKKVLIVGNLYALVKKMSELTEKVYVTQGNVHTEKFAETVDIREDKPFELLDFAVKNDIDLTIVTSKEAILSDISSVFQENNKAIFAPALDSAKTVLNRTSSKKLLYKLNVPTPKFASFDKISLALEYLETANYPLVISTDNLEQAGICHNTIEHAKCTVEDLFTRGEERVVIEEYAYGHEFSMYALTDGYQTIPLSTLANFRFSEKDYAGKLTNSMGCYLPDYKLSQELQGQIFGDVIVKAVDDLCRKNSPYMGIIGVDGVLCSDGSYKILNFKPFFNNVEAQAIMSSVYDDWYDLFDACANGLFADEYDDIPVNDDMFVACLVKSVFENKQIENLDLVESEISYFNVKKDCDDIYTSTKGDNFALTSSAKTFSRAKEKLRDDVDLIKFDGIKCRYDIL